MRSRMSLRSLATARIAITSDDTAMAKPDFIMKPFDLPPMPMMISRRDWAQKSMIHFISTLWGSMLSRFSFRLASCSSL